MSSCLEHAVNALQAWGERCRGKAASLKSFEWSVFLNLRYQAGEAEI
jgi:hypothetical protein